MKKIVIVNPFDEIPGETDVPTRYSTIFNLLTEDSWQVTWLTASFGHRKKKRRINDNPNIILFPVPAYENLSIRRIFSHFSYSIQVLIYLLKTSDERTLVLVSHPLISPAYYLYLLNKYGKIGGYIIDFQDSWPKSILPRYLKLLAIPLDSLTRMVSRSSMKNIAVAKYYLSERNILGETIYLGIDSNSVNYRKVSKNNKIIKFVFAGSLGRQYDLDSLYEVIKRLNRNEYTFTIDIAGYGNLPENLSMSNVNFHGVLNRDQLTELLLSNHCGLNLIAPGSHIALPNKVAEYFFHGLSIINGSSGELEELVENNNLGTNYQPGDVDSLYDAFIVEIKKHQNAEYNEEEINRFAIHHFSRSNIYPKLLTILNAAYEDLEIRL